MPVEKYENIFDCLGPQLGILSMSSMIHEESKLLFHKKVGHWSFSSHGPTQMLSSCVPAVSEDAQDEYLW